MLLWFVGVSFALVLMVFDSPMLDYRLVMAGSIVPWLDHIWGGPWPLHSLAAPVVVMALVMVVLRGQRLRQRRWIGVPIGMFMHLVLSGTFTSRHLFWWPFFGSGPGETPPQPGPVLAVVLELVGLAVLVWLASRLRLLGGERRALFLRTGHIDRSVMR